MKTILIGIATVALVGAMPAAAHPHHKAHGHGHAHGHAMAHRHHAMDEGPRVKTVKIDGQDVAVCTEPGQDKCVNPREAGLHWGNVPTETYRGGHDAAPPPAPPHH